MSRRRWLPLAALLAGCAAAPPAADARPWHDLLAAAALEHWHVTAFGGEGEVSLRPGEVRLDQGSPLTGITWQGPPPQGAYELEIVAARQQGNDFFAGVTFPIGEQHATLIVGGWGGSLVGLSCIDGLDAARNPTARRMAFRREQPYRIRIVVDDVVRAWIDGEEMLAVMRAGRTFGLRAEVTLSAPLGVCAFATQAVITTCRWRPRDAAAEPVADRLAGAQ